MIDQIINEFNAIHLTVICSAFLLGGLVKGISSFGLPTVSVPFLVMVLPLPSAISVLAIPLILSNFVQMLMSGDVKGSLQRHWTVLLPMLITLPIGVYFLTTVDIRTLTVFLGAILILITSLELLGVPLSFLKRHENFFGPLLGAGSGIIGGMTSLFGIIPIFFFVALGLSKERFVSIVSVLLFTGSVVMAVSLERSSFLGPLEVFYGLVGMIPIMFGIWVGTHIRKKVDQILFRKVVLFMILLVGVSMIYRSVGM